MILSNHVTPQGWSDQFPLYESGTATVRYDVHVRIEPESDTVGTLMVYKRPGDLSLHGKWETVSTLITGQRIAAEVWKRYGKFVPSEVLS